MSGNKLSDTVRRIRIVAAILGICCLVISVGIGYEINSSGLYADATHTPAEITWPEVFWTISAIVLFIISFLLFVKAQNIADALNDLPNKESNGHSIEK